MPGWSLSSKARGPFRDEAEETATRIQYDWKLSGDTLRLPDSFILKKGEEWRKQEMDLKLYLPQGTFFSMDYNSERILRGNSHFSRSDIAGNLCTIEGKGITIVSGP